MNAPPDHFTMSDPTQFPSTKRDLQEAITNRLKSCSALSGIDVFDRRTGDIENKINEQLASIGVAIFVSAVRLRGITPDVPAISSDQGDFTVRIFEDPTTNDTGRDIAALEEIVERRLHQWDPGVEGCGTITIDPDPEDDVRRKKGTGTDILFHVSVTLEQGID
jgi:hypothetical protein